MPKFKFEPGLFDLRAKTSDALTEAGFDWFTHYSSIDPMHDVFGIEVCGIREKEHAIKIQAILRRLFWSWKYSRYYLKDWGDMDIGWIVDIHRDREVQQGFRP